MNKHDDIANLIAGIHKMMRLKHSLPFNQDWATNPARKEFEEKNAVSDFERYCLAFGAVQFSKDGQTSKTLKLHNIKEKEIRKNIEADYFIGSHDSALNFLNHTSNCDGATNSIDLIFWCFKKGIPAPKMRGYLQKLYRDKSFDFDYESRAEAGVLLGVLNKVIDKMGAEKDDWHYDIDENADFDDFEDEDDYDKDDDLECLDEGDLDYEIGSINNNYMRCIASFISLVTNVGYSKDELFEIGTLAAWDLGRAAYIARYAFCAGYISENEAWSYMQKVAAKATSVYKSWREFAAAYVIGFSLSEEENAQVFADALTFLLSSDDSPWKELEFTSIA